MKYNGKYRKAEGFQMDQNMTLEKRIAAELYSYQGRMSVFVDDLRGSTIIVDYASAISYGTSGVDRKSVV